MTASIIFHNTKKRTHASKVFTYFKKLSHVVLFFLYLLYLSLKCILMYFMPTVFFCVFVFCVFFPGLRKQTFFFFANGIELVLFILKHFPNQPASCSLHSHHPHHLQIRTIFISMLLMLVSSGLLPHTSVLASLLLAVLLVLVMLLLFISCCLAIVKPKCEK